MKIDQLKEARKIWLNSFDEKKNTVKEVIRLRKSIMLYEEFVRSLPQEIITKLYEEGALY
jgi:hypothetical protein